MKNLIKYTTMLLMFFVAATAMTSCGKDDDEPDSKGIVKALVGTWAHDCDEYIEYLQFRSDGTGRVYWSDEDEDDGFSWTATKTQIHVVWEDGEEDVATYSINGKELWIDEEVVYIKQ